MTTYETYLLFKRYCDEPDQSFMSNSEAALFLKLGYAEFLRFADEYAPTARLRGTLIAVANTNTYDLTQNNSTAAAQNTPSLLGANPNQTQDGVNWVNLGRMTRLIGVHAWNLTTNRIEQTYQLVQDPTQLNNWNQVAWQGNTMTFATNQNRAFMLLYNFEQEIGFPAAAAGAVAAGQPSQSWSGVITQATAVNINDNFQQWHDMIALFAYAQYAILDAANNAQVLNQLAQRKAEFKEYLQQRNYGSVQYVAQTDDPSDTTIYIA
jgi:hypothetical protein